MASLEEVSPQAAESVIRHQSMPSGSQEEPVNDAFISHCTPDKDVALKMKLQLQAMQVPGQKRPFKIWTYEDDILFGMVLTKALEKAIWNSRRFVMLASPDLFQTEYCLNEHAMAQLKENELGFVFCIPVLHKMKAEELPDYMKHLVCLEFTDDDAFYNKLAKALSNDVPLSSRIEVNRTGVGLAWSYYYGYFDIILPGLQDRIKAHRDFSHAYPKFLSIMTWSCTAPPNIQDIDKNFEHQGVITWSMSKAGNVGRDYSNSVYKFTYTPPHSLLGQHPALTKETKTKEPKEEVHYLVMEFATPLFSLHKMAEGGLANLDPNAMKVERDKFKEVVEQILNYPALNKCKDKCLIVDFQDVDFQTGSTVLPKQTLSEAVWRALEHDMRKEKFKHSAPSKDDAGTSLQA